MSELTHFDERGNARMVDVGAKQPSARTAIAQGIVTMKPETLTRVRDLRIEKGDVLQLARIAGIMGAKKTSELIPLCHPLKIDAVELEFEFESDTTLAILATVRATDRTGVEMESLTAVSIAALTVYDMCKSIDRDIELGPITLLSKSGGKCGDWRRNERH